MAAVAIVLLAGFSAETPSYPPVCRMYEENTGVCAESHDPRSHIWPLVHHSSSRLFSLSPYCCLNEVNRCSTLASPPLFEVHMGLNHPPERIVDDAPGDRLHLVLRTTELPTVFSDQTNELEEKMLKHTWEPTSCGHCVRAGCNPPSLRIAHYYVGTPCPSPSATSRAASRCGT